MTNAQLMTETLEELSRLALEMDTTNESSQILYADEDAVNVFITFNHVCSNIAIHRMLREGRSAEENEVRCTMNAKMMSCIFEQITGINPRNFFKKGGKTERI